VDIGLELAVLVVRADDGKQVTYDPVEMVFDPQLNLVDHLQAPARIPSATAAAARALADRVADAFGAPGLYAVEMFLTRNGQLLVNETAPRAHNSGHHTIEACASSQFDQLLRCYMQWPLGDTRLRSLAAMVNLVGSGGTGEPSLMGAEEVLALPGTFPHLYGKAETRSGRKMGHVTVMAEDQQALERAIHIVRDRCRVVPVTSSAEAK
jgi:5-(carboxyamino)imidazole ribonucleotide synthase